MVGAAAVELEGRGESYAAESPVRFMLVCFAVKHLTLMAKACSLQI